MEMRRRDSLPSDWVAMRVIGVERGRLGASPLLVLCEVEGPCEFRTHLTSDQAHLLAHEFNGDPTRYSLSCGLIEEILTWLGAQVIEVRLVGDGQQGVRAEVELEAYLQRRAVRADVGDAALLAWRRGIPVRVSSALVHVEQANDNQETAIEGFRRFLDQVWPEEFAR